MSEESEATYEFDVDNWFKENRESIKEALEVAAGAYIQSGGFQDDWVNLYFTIADGSTVGTGADSFDLGDYWEEVGAPAPKEPAAPDEQVAGE